MARLTAVEEEIAQLEPIPKMELQAAAVARRGHAFWDHSATLGIRTCCSWSFGQYLFSGSGCRAATTPPRAAAERLARAARFAGSLCAAARGYLVSLTLTQVGWLEEDTFVYLRGTMVGTARRAVPARVVAGGTNCRATPAVEEVAPLHAARTSQRDVPTTLNRYARGATRRSGTSSTTLNRSFGHSRGPIVVPRCAHHRRQGKEFLVSTIRPRANSCDSRLPDNALPAMLRTKF